MKKIIALLLALALVFAFCACTQTNKEDDKKEDEKKEETKEDEKKEDEKKEDEKKEDEKKEDEKKDESKDEKQVYDYSKYINKNSITYFCNTNEVYIEDNDVKGIIVELPGLGGSSCLGGSVDMYSDTYGSQFAQSCARKGIVLAYIFPGPWSWGNTAAMRMTDAVIDAIAKKYHLVGDYPVAVMGGSMGGIGALNFASDSVHNIVACAAACPCTDVLAAFKVQKSFPRTFVSAVAGYDMDLEDALKAISPIERLDRMPDIPYYICSDGNDECFPEKEVDVYVEKLKEKVSDVQYFRQPGLSHGGFTEEVKEGLYDFLIDKIRENIKKNAK